MGLSGLDTKFRTNACLSRGRMMTGTGRGRAGAIPCSRSGRPLVGGACGSGARMV
ncbi:hypothetical protein [Azospirillum doebereinerae]